MSEAGEDGDDSSEVEDLVSAEMGGQLLGRWAWGVGAEATTLPTTLEPVIVVRFVEQENAEPETWLFKAVDGNHFGLILIQALRAAEGDDQVEEPSGALDLLRRHRSRPGPVCGRRMSRRQDGP